MSKNLEPISFSDINPDLPEDPWALSELFDIELEVRPKDTGFREEAIEEADTPDVTSEEYDGVERTLFEKIKDRVRTATNLNTIPIRRSEALEWCFSSFSEDKHGISFRVACQALGARHILLQIRMQYQFYKVGIALTEALPLFADGLPEAIAMEIIIHAGDDGLDLARQVWRWPGIRADELRNRLSDMSEADFHRTCRRLEQSGHLILKHGYWYLICRNPELLAIEGRRRFSWAKSIMGDK